MSRIAKYPVNLPAGVEVNVAPDQIAIKGPLGSLTQPLNGDVLVKKDGDRLTFVAARETQQSNAMSGTLRALVSNMVLGVTKGFERKLTLVGVGYRAQAQGDSINLALGFSHPVVHKLPKGVKAELEALEEAAGAGDDSVGELPVTDAS